MPRTRECDFCGADIEPGTGTMVVHNDGSTIHYCSSKCEKNSDLGREARDVEWTESGRSAGDKRAAETADEPESEPEPEPEPEPEAGADDSAAPDLEAAEADEDSDESAADENADADEPEEEEAEV